MSTYLDMVRVTCWAGFSRQCYHCRRDDVGCNFEPTLPTALPWGEGRCVAMWSPYCPEVSHGSSLAGYFWVLVILGRTRIMLGPGCSRAAKQDCRVQNYLPSGIKVSNLDPFVNRDHYFLHSKSGHNSGMTKPFILRNVWAASSFGVAVVTFQEKSEESSVRRFTCGAGPLGTCQGMPCYGRCFLCRRSHPVRPA